MSPRRRIGTVVLVLAGTAVSAGPLGAATTPKQREANRKVQALVKDGRYVGTRGDGEAVDYTFCANGRFRTATGTGAGLGKARGKGWIIREAKRGAKGFTAHVDEPKSGLSIGIKRGTKQWYIGVSRSFGGVENVGKVTRTSAKTECRTL